MDVAPTCSFIPSLFCANGRGGFGSQTAADLRRPPKIPHNHTVGILWRRLTGNTHPTFWNFPVTPTPNTFSKVLPYKWEAYCRTNGSVLQYKWEVYCWVCLLQGLEARKVQRYKWGGVLPYKLEVCCRTFFETSRGWGFRNF